MRKPKQPRQVKKTEQEKQKRSLLKEERPAVFVKTYTIEVSGRNACFTNPLTKRDPVSYDVITPSAARGIFMSFLDKKSSRWDITKIEVLNPIRRENFKFNGIGTVVGGKLENCRKYIYANENRIQKNMNILADVKYRITADLMFIRPEDRDVLDEDPGPDEKPIKLAKIFERRIERHDVTHDPYFGMSQYFANVRLVKDGDERPEPIKESRDLGWMIWGVNPYAIKGKSIRSIYHAYMIDGVINVPAWGSMDVRHKVLDSEETSNIG